MNEVLLIWGAGGHGKVILDIARSTRRFERILFADDDAARGSTTCCDCDVVGDCSQFDRFSGASVLIAIGDNHARARCFHFAVKSGLVPATLIHGSAIVSPSARIATGTVVMPGAVINAGSVIHENCIINTGAIVEHDCWVEPNVHISPRAVLGGGVRVGTFAHVGIGAVVLPGACIGRESIVGAGAVVLKEVSSGCTVVGVPAANISRKMSAER